MPSQSHPKTVPWRSQDMPGWMFVSCVSYAFDLTMSHYAITGTVSQLPAQQSDSCMRNNLKLWKNHTRTWANKLVSLSESSCNKALTHIDDLQLFQIDTSARMTAAKLGSASLSETNETVYQNPSSYQVVLLCCQAHRASSTAVGVAFVWRRSWMGQRRLHEGHFEVPHHQSFAVQQAACQDAQDAGQAQWEDAAGLQEMDRTGRNCLEHVMRVQSKSNESSASSTLVGRQACEAQERQPSSWQISLRLSRRECTKTHLHLLIPRWSFKKESRRELPLQRNQRRRPVTELPRGRVSTIAALQAHDVKIRKNATV